MWNLFRKCYKVNLTKYEQNIRYIYKKIWYNIENYIEGGENMKKNILRTVAVCMAFLFIMGYFIISESLTDEPGPRGSITETLHLM